MRFDLARLAKAAGRRRTRAIPIASPTQAQTDELATLYMEVVRAWQAATRGPIIAAYERALAQLEARDALVRDDAGQVERQIDSTAGDLLRLALVLTARLRDWALRVERWHRSRWLAGTLTASGVDLATLLGPEDMRDTIAGVIARNTALIRNVSDEARGRIADIVFRGLQARTPAREVAKELREAVDMSRRRSILIASDQLNKLTSALDHERRRQAGIPKWRWRHSGKLHFREEHKARDGKIYSDDDPPPDLPGQKPYCGCREQALLELD